MTEAKFKIFVSHVAEEAALGKAVKDGLEDAFSGRVAVFVSSDPRDNPGGDDWLQKIKRELKDSQACMLISLVGPASVREPWISIELGAAWILDRGVFPLCHSGQTLEGLPRPLQDFGGADLSNDEAAKRMVMAVEKATGLTAPKGWSRAEFLTDMREGAHQTAKRGTGTTPRGNEPRSVASLPERRGHIDLEPEQVRILQALARAHDEGREEVPADTLPGLTRLRPALCTYHADHLFRLGLIYVEVWSGGKDYKIKPSGIGWLVEHRALPGEE